VELAYLFAVELRLLPPRQCYLLLSGQPTAPAVQEHLQQLRQQEATLDSATRTKILTTVLKVCKYGRQPSDVLVVSFSSHGFADKGAPYVMPSDGIRAFLSETAVPLRTIEDKMEGEQDAPKAGHRLLLVDACQERVSAKNMGRESAGQPMSPAFADVLKTATGQAKLASCSAGELSYEHSSLGGVGHGVFTFALLEGLRGGARADEQNLVRLGSVADYVAQRVGDWCRERGWKQTPCLASPPPTRQMPLALRADDLVLLVARVQRQPLSGQFTAALRQQLVTRLVGWTWLPLRTALLWRGRGSSCAGRCPETCSCPTCAARSCCDCWTLRPSSRCGRRTPRAR